MKSTLPTREEIKAGGLRPLRVGGTHVRPSDLPGCVEVSAEFLCAMAAYGQKKKAKAA